MKEEIEKVTEFHKKGRLPINKKFNKKAWLEHQQLRINLLFEEFTEYFTAEEKYDIEEVSDALADMLYIIYGTAITYGLPIEEIFNEVHNNNMEKFKYKLETRKDGKILKNRGHHKPNLKKIIYGDS